MKTTYSFSRLNNYLNCHYQYLQQYILKIPHQNYSMTLLRGSAIHHTIEYFWVCKSLGVIMSKTDAIQYYKDDFKYLWNQQNPSGSHWEVAAEYVLGGVPMIENAIDHVLPNIVVAIDHLGKPCVEEKWFLTLPNGNSIMGFKDTVAVDDDGQRLILDYKSKKPPDKRFFSKDIHGGLQMSMYCMADRHQYGQNGATEGAYVFLGADTPGKIFAWTNRTVDRQNEDLNSVVTLINHIEEKQKEYIATQEEMLFSPTPGNLCPYCTYATRCTVGQKWISDNNKKLMVLPLDTAL